MSILLCSLLLSAGIVLYYYLGCLAERSHDMTCVWIFGILTLGAGRRRNVCLALTCLASLCGARVWMRDVNLIIINVCVLCTGGQRTMLKRSAYIFVDCSMWGEMLFEHKL